MLQPARAPTLPVRAMLICSVATQAVALETLRDAISADTPITHDGHSMTTIKPMLCILRTDALQQASQPTNSNSQEERVPFTTEPNIKQLNTLKEGDMQPLATATARATEHKTHAVNLQCNTNVP